MPFPILCLFLAQALTTTPEVREIDGTQPAVHEITLAAGEFVALEVRQLSAAVRARVLGPDGRDAAFGGTPLPRMPFGIGIPAASAGVYRVEVTTVTPGARGSYSIRVLERLPSAEAAAATPEVDRWESPQIGAARRAGSSAPVWKAVEQSGAPLIELPADDPQHALVTFVYRDTPGTRTVQVDLFPFSLVDRDAWRMRRLAATELWYVTVRLPRAARFPYTLRRNPMGSTGLFPSTAEEARQVLWDQPQADPLNPRAYQGASLVELPDAPAQLWIEPRPGVPAGTIEKFAVASKSLGNEREIALYRPAARAQSYPVLIVMDGPVYQSLVPVPVILDNLIHAGKIPPMLAVFVPNVSTETRYRELGCSAEFGTFLAQELLPAVRARVRGAEDRAVIAGSSRAGLMAVCAALQRPRVFSRVLAQSGILWWDPSLSYFVDDPGKFKTDLKARANWAAGEFARLPKMDLRIHLEAGLFETSPADQGNRGILEANRHLHDVLRAKGYRVRYVEFAGGHDYLNWRGTFGDALVFLMDGSRRAKLAKP